MVEFVGFASFPISSAWKVRGTLVAEARNDRERLDSDDDDASGKDGGLDALFLVRNKPEEVCETSHNMMNSC